MPLSPTVCRWRNIILISFDVIVKKGYRGIEPLKYYPNKPFIDLSLYHPYFFNIATTGIAKKYNSPVIVTIIDLDFHLDSLSRHSLLELLSLFIHYCLNVRFSPVFHGYCTAIFNSPYLLQSKDSQSYDFFGAGAVTH